jgi:two-component system cell cycle response regulator DivK
MLPSQPPRTPRILIVEDHADTRQMYAAFLSASFEVIEAADGNEALAAAREHRPDAIVTDMSLPGMDGFELIQQLRREGATKDTAVLCLSGFSGERHEERAREAGCDRVVQKPCLPDALAEAIAIALAEHRDRSRS